MPAFYRRVDSVCRNRFPACTLLWPVSEQRLPRLRQKSRQVKGPHTHLRCSATMALDAWCRANKEHARNDSLSWSRRPCRFCAVFQPAARSPVLQTAAESPGPAGLTSLPDLINSSSTICLLQFGLFTMAENSDCSPLGPASALLLGNIPPKLPAGHGPPEWSLVAAR